MCRSCSRKTWWFQSSIRPCEGRAFSLGRSLICSAQFIGAEKRSLSVIFFALGPTLRSWREFTGSAMPAWEMLTLRALADFTATFESMAVASIEIEVLLGIHLRLLAIIGAR
jgi:hypothetical protein